MPFDVITMTKPIMAQIIILLPVVILSGLPAAETNIKAPIKIATGAATIANVNNQLPILSKKAIASVSF
jgi:hypothetical protein